MQTRLEQQRYCAPCIRINRPPLLAEMHMHFYPPLLQSFGFVKKFPDSSPGQHHWPFTSWSPTRYCTPPPANERLQLLHKRIVETVNFALGAAGHLKSQSPTSWISKRQSHRIRDGPRSNWPTASATFGAPACLQVQLQSHKRLKPIFSRTSASKLHTASP